MLPLLRALGIRDTTADERRAAIWIGAMFCCALASTFVLRSLRDQFGVDRGVERMPYLYGLTLLATVLALPPFWWLCNRMPSRRFVPIALQCAALAVLALWFGLTVIGDYEWQRAPWVGEAFWGGYNAFNVIVPTLVWIHAVEHFRRDQAVRLFGLIAVGGTLGAVFGSWLAGWLVSGLRLPPSATAIASIVLLQGAFVCYLLSLRPCARIQVDREPARTVSSGGMLAGMRLLLREGRLRAIACYMILLGMVATTFYVAQTELVGAQIEAGRRQHRLLADIEFWSQSLVLVLQLFCTARLMRRLPAALLLMALPLSSILGLAAYWAWPVVTGIALVQIGRRGVQYAVEKPAREALWTPFGLETKHKAKFLVDTVAFRLGDLLGAGLQVFLLNQRLGLRGAAVATGVLALSWAALGARLGSGLGGRGRPGAGDAVEPAAIGKT